METNIPYHLIASQLDGSIGKTDKATLDAWLNESAENRAIFEKNKMLWSESGQLSQQFSPNVHAALNKVHARLDVGTTTKTVSLRSNLSLFYKIAAGLALVIISGYLYFNLRTPVMLIAESGLNEKLELITGDGTKVLLNKGSKLIYPEYFKNKERKVKLEGEAYFEVAKDSTHPFVIEAFGSQTKVLGTKFDLKANENDSLITINLVEGKVAFSNVVSNELIILVAGEKAIMNRSNGKASKLVQESKNFESWRSNILIFENTALTTVAKELGEYYRKSIVIKDTTIAKLRLNGTFNNQPLSMVAMAIEEALNVQFTEKGNTIEVSSK